MSFQRGKIGQAATHVSVVHKVGCYGMAVGMWEMWGGRILAEITLRFCTPGKGSLKLEDSSGQGKETRKVWQGLAQFALSLCHLAFLAYKEHTALVIAYIQEKMYNHGKAEANPGRTYIRECTMALLQVAQLKDMFELHLLNPAQKLLLTPLHNLIIPISAGLDTPPQLGWILSRKTLLPFQHNNVEQYCRAETSAPCRWIH